VYQNLTKFTSQDITALADVPFVRRTVMSEIAFSSQHTTYLNTPNSRAKLIIGSTSTIKSVNPVDAV
jgi:hypothetical protein